MANVVSYDVTANFNNHADAIEFLKGFVWDECETTETTMNTIDYECIDVHQNVGCCYNHIANDYMFIQL